MRRGYGYGLLAGSVGCVLGGAIGWYAIGPITNDFHIWLVLGMIAGSLAGFLALGPPGRSLIVSFTVVGAILGAIVGGFLGEGEELGQVLWVWGGGFVGLGVGFGAGAAVVAWANRLLTSDPDQ